MKKLVVNPYLVIFISLTLLAVIGGLWISIPAFPLDDAYIVQSSVNTLFHNAPIRFDVNSPLDGVTSLVHVLLISFFSILISTEWAQFLSIFIATVLYVFAVFRFSIIQEVSPYWALLLSYLSLIAGLSLYHVLNGLETGLAMAAVAWVAVFFATPVPNDNRKYLLLGIIPFIRPELAILSAIVYIRALWNLRGTNKENQKAIVAALIILLGAAPLILIMLFFGQSGLPNTLSAKAYFFAEGCLPFTVKSGVIFSGISSFLTGMGIVSLGFIAICQSKIKYVFIAFATLFLLAYFLKLPGGLFHNHHRYLYIFAPFAVLGWATWLGAKKATLSTIGKILLIFVTIHSAFGINDTWRIYLDGLNISRVQLKGASDWVNINIPPDKTIMVHDVGFISLLGENPLVDIVGLKTPSSIEVNKIQTWILCARNPNALDQIARNNSASYFIVLDTWDQLFGLTQSLKLIGWQVVRVDAYRGNTMYKIYSITPPSRP